MHLRPTESFPDRPKAPSLLKSRAAALALSVATLVSACNEKREPLPVVDAAEPAPETPSVDATPEASSLVPVLSQTPVIIIPAFDTPEGSGETAEGSDDDYVGSVPDIVFPNPEGQTYDEMMTDLAERHCNKPEIRELFETDPIAVRFPEFGVNWCMNIPENVFLESGPRTVSLVVSDDVRLVLAEAFPVDFTVRSDNEVAYTFVEAVNQLRLRPYFTPNALAVTQEILAENVENHSRDLTVLTLHVEPDFDPENPSLRIDVATIHTCPTDETQCTHDIYADCELHRQCDTDSATGLITNTDIPGVGLVIRTVTNGEEIIVSDEGLVDIGPTIATDAKLLGEASPYLYANDTVGE